MYKEKDTAAGQSTVGFKQLSRDVDSLALHPLAVVSKCQFVEMWQHN